MACVLIVTLLLYFISHLVNTDKVNWVHSITIKFGIILCKFDYFLFKHKNLCFKMLNHSIWISEVSFHNIPDSSLAISNLFYDLTWSHWSVQLCKSEFEFVHTNKNYFNGIIRCVCTQLSFHWKLTADSGPLFLIVTGSWLGIDFSISKRNFVLIFTVCGSLNCPEEGRRISSYWFLLGIALQT